MWLCNALFYVLLCIILFNWLPQRCHLASRNQGARMMHCKTHASNYNLIPCHFGSDIISAVQITLFICKWWTSPCQSGTIRHKPVTDFTKSSVQYFFYSCLNWRFFEESPNSQRTGMSSIKSRSFVLLEAFLTHHNTSEIWIIKTTGHTHTLCFTHTPTHELIYILTNQWA